jgi:hypothetical protein
MFEYHRQTLLDPFCHRRASASNPARILFSYFEHGGTVSLGVAAQGQALGSLQVSLPRQNLHSAFSHSLSTPRELPAAEVRLTCFHVLS